MEQEKLLERIKYLENKNKECLAVLKCLKDVYKYYLFIVGIDIFYVPGMLLNDLKNRIDKILKDDDLK